MTVAEATTEPAGADGSQLLSLGTHRRATLCDGSISLFYRNDLTSAPERARRELPLQHSCQSSLMIEVVLDVLRNRATWSDSDTFAMIQAGFRLWLAV